MNKIKRKHISMLGGVAAGIAYQNKIPVWVVRLLMLIGLVTPLFWLIILGYIVAWVVLKPLNINVEQFNARTRFKGFPSKVNESAIASLDKDELLSEKKKLKELKDE